MKLGRPVFITRSAVEEADASATTSEVRTATQTLTCQWVIMMPVIRPVVPGHRAGRQVELATDHQQRHGDRHDRERRRR